MNVEERIAAQEARCKEYFARIDKIALFNQEKVLNAFTAERVALRHFLPSTGYGYGDEGRETLGRIYARAFGAESALVSPALLSGTHALTVALFGVLRPQESALCITGTPYDTIRAVVWGKDGKGSLADFQIGFDVVELCADGTVDFSAVKKAMREREYRMIYIQRSRGYELRDAFSVAQIETMCRFVRENGFQEIGRAHV